MFQAPPLFPLNLPTGDIVKNGKRNDEVLFDRQSDIKAEPFESLTEEELIHLVKGFKDLDQKDQRDLIDYMKKLEKTNLAMVQRVKIGVSDTYFG